MSLSFLIATCAFVFFITAVCWPWPQSHSLVLFRVSESAIFSHCHTFNQFCRRSLISIKDFAAFLWVLHCCFISITLLFSNVSWPLTLPMPLTYFASNLSQWSLFFLSVLCSKRLLKLSLHIIMALTFPCTCTRLCVYTLTWVCVCVSLWLHVCVCMRACRPDNFISNYLHHLTGLCHCSLASRLSGPVISRRRSQARSTLSAPFPPICRSLARPAPRKKPLSSPSSLRTLSSLWRQQ